MMLNLIPLSCFCLSMLYGVVANSTNDTIATNSTKTESQNHYCVPAKDFDHVRIKCVLIRPGTEEEEKEILESKLKAAAVNVTEEVRFLKLLKENIDRLNQFFAYQKLTDLNPDVFTNVSSVYFVKIVALPISRFHQFMESNEVHLSEHSRNLLANCNNAVCAQLGRFSEIVRPSKKFVNKIPMEKSVAEKVDELLRLTRVDREFRAEKVIRIEFGHMVLVAYSTSKSTFSVKKTENHMLREFREELRMEYVNYSHAQLVSAFRNYYHALL